MAVSTALSGTVVKVLSDLMGPDRPSVTAATLQSDGKLLVLEWCRTSTLLRYNPDGSLDESFGMGGMVNLAVGSWARGLAPQPDGKIIVSGVGPQDPTFWRYNTDGSFLDATFATGGLIAVG